MRWKPVRVDVVTPYYEQRNKTPAADRVNALQF